MSGGYLLNMEKKDKFKLNNLLQHLVIEEIKELMAQVVNSKGLM